MTGSLSPISRFRLEPFAGERPQAHLWDENEKTDTVVAGRVLDAQYGWSGGFLLLTTDDNPYEESLHIILLDDRMRRIDQVDLGQSYHPGLLRDLEVSERGGVVFSFFGTERWWLRVETHATFRLDWRPFASVRYPDGWWRPHHLRLVRADPPA